MLIMCNMFNGLRGCGPDCCCSWYVTLAPISDFL